MDKGSTIWFTGLSASGKSTLAKETVAFLEGKGFQVQLLDGDIMREEIGNLFGYTREDRIKTAKIYRSMARLLNRNGITVVVAAIAPYEEIRMANRDRIESYIEIFVNCSMEECIRRDPKGLYKKALAGKEKFVLGIDEKFEEPVQFELQINSHKESVEESMNKIKELLKGQQ